MRITIHFMFDTKTDAGVINFSDWFYEEQELFYIINYAYDKMQRFYPNAIMLKLWSE